MLFDRTISHVSELWAQALVQAQNNGVNSVSIDLPDYNPALVALDINHDPRNNRLAFNTTLFRPNALGTFGNSSRRFFYGPGINNYDIALHKVTRITESTSLELRFGGSMRSHRPTQPPLMVSAVGLSGKHDYVSIRPAIPDYVWHVDRSRW